MGNYHTCGPNEVLVISGGWSGGNVKRYVIGGCAYAFCCVTDVQRLSLELLTVYPYCANGETSQGVAVTVSTVAQCKIMKEIEFLKMAAEQFLGMDKEHIKYNIRNTLEGSLRAILGTLTVEEIYKDREMFSKRVCQVAAPDMARMGIAILSFTIKDIWDNVDYLKSLGKTQIAAVKRNAAIGVALAERDAGIREAECQREAQSVVFEMNTRIENYARMYQLAKAAFDQEVNAAKAQAALAYELQAAKVRQQIRNEEVQIDIIERKKDGEIEAKEVDRKDKELFSTVRLPAEADSYCIETIAEGNKTKTIEEGKAAALTTQFQGSSQAWVLEKVGNAEAELMLLKAKVFQTYCRAATMSLVLEALPRITSQSCLPLQNINEIVILGGSDGITADVNRLLSQIPPSVSAIAAEGLEKLLNKRL